MDIIHLLPDSVANQIAAGEVIQRPASCLKELVENSLDAGAKHIHVIVYDAGRTLLQVTDDGCGMSETDARMAFERHATSKIAQAQDLFALRTMGFRGEALASICAVAQVEVQTRRAEDDYGTLLDIQGSQVMRQEPCSCPVGTNFKVKNLFYNVPVRRKFLKTDKTELRNLLTDFYRIVLVYPDVQFTFVSDDEVMLDLHPGTYKQRIEQVFGRSGSNPFTSRMVDLRTETELVSIHGFVGKPEAASRNPQQYFFVNGRFMRHPYFHKAVMNAYSGMLPGELMPSYFIYFDIHPDLIDVNIHPTKTEIKFADEQAVFQILMAAVRESLGKFNVSPSLDFNREGEIEMPVGMTPADTAPQVRVNPAYNPFKTRPMDATPQGWQSLYAAPDAAPDAATLTRESRIGRLTETDLTEEQPGTLALDIDSLEGRALYRYAGRYILVPTDEGLLLVNQRRAHLCVLYALYRDLLTHAGQAPAQQLLFPELLSLTADEMTLMQSLLPGLEAVGFVLEQIGRTEYSITAVPSLLTDGSAVSTLRAILGEVSRTGSLPQDEWERRIALSMARETAMPYGKNLSDDEMRDLLTRLLRLPAWQYTPDGQRVTYLLTLEQLNQYFQ